MKSGVLIYVFTWMDGWIWMDLMGQRKTERDKERDYGAQ